MKKLLCAWIALALLLSAACGLGESLFVDNRETDKIYPERLNLRAQPAKNGAILGLYYTGTEVNVLSLIHISTAVSFADVPNDIDAVRVTYLNAQTGEELAEGGFTPGQITLNVKTGVDGAATLNARTTFALSLIHI